MAKPVSKRKHCVSEKEEKQESSLWSNVKVIVQALLLAVVIKTFLFQPFMACADRQLPVRAHLHIIIQRLHRLIIEAVA